MKCNYKPSKPLSKEDRENFINGFLDYLTLIEKTKEGDEEKIKQAQLDYKLFRMIKDHSLF